MKINDLLENYRYMPTDFRDFHDQKDLFKLIFSKVELHKEIEHISWIDAHIFTVDIFLYFMAKRGYTLQKARHRIDFINIQEEINNLHMQQLKSLEAILSSQSVGNTSKEGDPST